MCCQARLVLRGFLQEEGVDYSEILAPTAQSTSFRTLTSIAAEMNLAMQRFNVSTAFVNGVLEDELYVRQPPIHSSSRKVWKLKKVLYGLKQAARVWNVTLSEQLVAPKFLQSSADPFLFFQGDGLKAIHLLVLADDAVFWGSL
jgi:hypothetical protein